MTDFSRGFRGEVLTDVPVARHKACRTALTFGRHGERWCEDGTRELVLWCPRCLLEVRPAEATERPPYVAWM